MFGGYRRACGIAGCLLVAAAPASGCGGQTATTTSAAVANARTRRDAFVAFYDAWAAAVPARKASLQAALRLRAAVTSSTPSLGAARHALGEYLASARTCRHLMEALPAANAELAAVRTKYVRAAQGESQFVKDYGDVMSAAAKGRPYTKLAARAEAAKSAYLAMNDEAAGELEAVARRLGGLRAFGGRIDTNALKQLADSMRQEAAQ